MIEMNKRILRETSSKQIKNIKKANKFLSKAGKELSAFFGVDIHKPGIFFLNSRKEIDKSLGRKTEEWLTGWTKGNAIFVLTPQNYLKESSHKSINHFWQVLKHEYCHLYFGQIAGVNYPKWLNEGLACYLAGQIKKEPTLKEAMKVFKYFRKSDWQVYNVGYFWVNLLVQKFGKNKMLRLMKNLKPHITEKEFAAIFRRIYGFDFSKNSFNKIHHAWIKNT